MQNGVKNIFTDIYNSAWTQLLIVDGILCCHYSPGPVSELVTVPILPCALQQGAPNQAHDIPGSGHQGHDKAVSKYILDGNFQ